MDQVGSGSEPWERAAGSGQLAAATRETTGRAAHPGLVRRPPCRCTSPLSLQQMAILHGPEYQRVQSTNRAPTALPVLEPLAVALHLHKSPPPTLPSLCSAPALCPSSTTGAGAVHHKVFHNQVN